MRAARATTIAAAAALAIGTMAVTSTTTPAGADELPAMTIGQNAVLNTDTGVLSTGGSFGTDQSSGIGGFPGWRVIELSSLSVSINATLTITGSRVPVFRVDGPVDIDGTINVGPSGSAPGPGGGAGGATGVNPNSGVSAGGGGQGMGGGGGGAYHSNALSIHGTPGTSISPGTGGAGGAGACESVSNLARGGSNGIVVAPSGLCGIHFGPTTQYQGGGASGAGGRLFNRVPIGGSGGGGGASTSTSPGVAGAPGAGAIEIDSTSVIEVIGQIRAVGGMPANSSGGAGGGGVVWLRAPIVDVHSAGELKALGGALANPFNHGAIQIDADCAELDGTIQPTASRSAYTLGAPTRGAPCQADLAVTDITEPSAAVARGADIEVGDVTANVGNIPASASITAYFLKDLADVLPDVQLGTRPVPALGVSVGDTSQLSTMTIPLDTTPGTYQLRVCADHGAAVIESSESNCALSSSFQVVDPPDLGVTVLEVTPSSVERGADVTVSDSTANTGGSTAPASLTAYFLSFDELVGADQFLGSREVPELGPSQVSTTSVAVTVPGEAFPGTYFVIACADTLGVVTEADEADNCVANAIEVTDFPPNLVMSGVAAPPASRVQGQSFQVAHTVENLGAGAAGQSTVQYELRDPGADTTVGSLDVPPLLSGENDSNGTIVTVPMSLAPGIYELRACVDLIDVVVESDESDNCATGGTMTVIKARPDLVVSAVSDPPVSRARGGSFKVIDTVRNRGAVRAASSQTAYFLSSDRARGGDQALTGGRLVPSLQPTKTSPGNATVAIPRVTPVGKYFLLSCADGSKAVKESDEANNCKASAAKVSVTRASTNFSPRFLPGPVDRRHRRS